MKKMISKFADSLLSKEDLKKVKGGYGDDGWGCGYCATFSGTVLVCLAIGGPWGCKCPTFNSNNACG